MTAAANATPLRVRTVRFMTNSKRRIDDRHAADSPQGHLREGKLFGSPKHKNPELRSVPGALSAEVTRATTQHALAHAINLADDKSSQKRIHRASGASPGMVSKILSGEKWAPAMVIAAMQDEVKRLGPRKPGERPIA